jgi:hypothetical protein
MSIGCGSGTLAADGSRCSNDVKWGLAAAI